jgi:hypothetical protein
VRVGRFGRRDRDGVNGHRDSAIAPGSPTTNLPDMVHPASSSQLADPDRAESPRAATQLDRVA